MTDLPNIGRPAKAALKTVGITQLEQVAKIDKNQLGKLHGLGPKALDILETHLLEEGLTFGQELEDLPKVPFFVTGDLSCNNAPKRQIARDLVIALFANKKTLLDELVTDEVEYQMPGINQIKGRAAVSEHFSELGAISSLELETILSHGKEAALRGRITSKAGKTSFFAIFLIFEGHKKASLIQKIIHYRND